jgi:hypothetical protein
VPVAVAEPAADELPGGERKQVRRDREADPGD